MYSGINFEVGALYMSFFYMPQSYVIAVLSTVFLGRFSILTIVYWCFALFWSDYCCFICVWALWFLLSYFFKTLLTWFWPVRKISVLADNSRLWHLGRIPFPLCFYSLKLPLTYLVLLSIDIQGSCWSAFGSLIGVKALFRDSSAHVRSVCLISYIAIFSALESWMLS